jgi:hypothetical protein
MKREVLVAASPQGWPLPQHRAAARLRRAAAPQNTTNSHSETLCTEFGITILAPNQSLMNAYKKDGRDAEHIPPILMPSGDTYLSSR